MKHLFTLILSFFTLAFANATVHNVSSSGLTFTPDAITINQGDSVIWNLTGSHDVVEVSQATYLAGGNTSNGGFSTPFGGGTVVFDTPGLFYYVCTPHASLGMVGTINVAAGPPVLTQMDLPVTFDDATVNYSLIDFGTTVSTIVVDPTDPSNTVVQTIKTAGSPTWAGTTLAEPNGGANLDVGFLNPIPFAVGATSMSVRVWSTGPGIPVRLKVEQDTNNTINCETEALTTVTNAWETLVFDFSNEATGTAALNIANTYNKASLFYNFGTAGTGETFYWDDVEFVTPGPPVSGTIDFAVDMRGYTGTEDFTTTGVFINGAYNSFCGTCNPMEDLDGDSIYTASLVIPAGPQEFKYTIGAFVDEESLTPGDPCVLTTGAFTNRIITVNGDATLDTICWNACTPCTSGPPPPVPGTIDFAVDMRGYTGTEDFTTTGVFINGAYNGFCGTCNPMEDLDGDSIYTASLVIPAGPQEFKYTIGAFVDEESLTPGDPCVLTTGAFTNRIITVNGDATLDTICWNSCVSCIGTPPDPCLGVSPDPNILDDFECQGNITYTFANATWNEVVTNPNPTGINNTDRVGEFIHWGAGNDGAFGGSLDLAPIDLTNSGGQFKMDVHPSEVGLPIVFILQDSNGADLANQTALTTVAGEWETLSYDMSDALTSNDVSKIVLVVASGDSVQHVVYFDNIRLDTVSVSPCAGITPEPSIFDDFECQGNFTYTFANATWAEDVANPNASGINTSAKVGQFIHWGDSTDGAFGGSLNLAPIDLNFYGTTLTIDVHSSASGLPVTVVFQDAAGADILAQNANTTVAGQWETLSYDFSGASGPVSKVVFVVSPNDTVQHELYFDNIRLDTSTAIATCPGIAPDVDVMEDFDCQRNTTYTSTDGSLAVIINPDTTGINTSDNVGEYTRSSLSADAITADFNLAPLDFATHNQMKLDVWDASVPSVVEITLLDAAGISLATATATTSVGNAWEQLNFDFQLVPFTASVAKATLQFDSGSSSASNKVYYYDNWKMDGVLTGMRDLDMNALSVYPNPVNEFINLDMNVLDLNSELTANIVTADGRIIQSTNIASGTRIERIDVSQLSSGMYFIELTDSKSKWMSKFVKK